MEGVQPWHNNHYLLPCRPVTQSPTVIAKISPGPIHFPLIAYPPLAYPPDAEQEAFEAAIDVARRRTVEEVQRWGSSCAAATTAGTDASAADAAAGAPASDALDDTHRLDQPPRSDGEGLEEAGQGGRVGGAVTPPRASERKWRDKRRQVEGGDDAYQVGG